MRLDQLVYPCQKSLRKSFTPDYEYLNITDSIPKFQFGFRSNHSLGHWFN